MSIFIVQHQEKAILSIHIYDLSQWDDYLTRIKQSISAKHIDIPIYIGETGMYWNNKETSGPLLKKMLASARENNISAAIWDDSQSMGYINRTTGVWYDKSFMDEVVEAGKSKKPAQPIEPTTEEKTTEVTTEEKTTEVTTEEKTTEVTTEEKTTEVTTEEKTTEVTTEEKTTEVTTEEKTTEVTTEEKSSEATIEAMPKKVTKLKLKALHSRKVMITWKKEKTSKGYQIVYATENKFKNRKVKSCKTAGIVLKKLKINKTYYIKVRAYRKINGKNVYGPWSKVKKVKIKK